MTKRTAMLFDLRIHGGKSNPHRAIRMTHEPYDLSYAEAQVIRGE
ncbi:hypothetical protein [Frankia sp. Cr1]|nr:hypothetical protein [Frankia sp. Cr1]